MTVQPIYLDNNATTHMDPLVLEAMIPFMRESFHNPSSPYRSGAAMRAVVESARRDIAECFGCRPAELVFCSGGTEADNLALRGTLQSVTGEKMHLAVSSVEHPAVLETARALGKNGAELTLLPVSRSGRVEIEALFACAKTRPQLISVMHANNETGVLQPVDEIAEIAKSHGSLFHVDAVQSTGKMTIDFTKSGADLISVSGHKFHGPKGIGILYVREGTKIASILKGGGQEFGFRAGTENVPAIVGLARAVFLATENIHKDAETMARLRNRFESALVGSLSNITVVGAEVPRLPNTACVVLNDIDGESAVLEMDIRGVQISTGSACASGSEAPSHVLLAMGLLPRQAQGAVRISLSKYTTEGEVDTAACALIETVTRLRALSSI